MLGEGVVPGVHFSLSRYDFGACFIHRAGLPTHSAVLHITNRDLKEVRYVPCSTSQIQFMLKYPFQTTTKPTNKPQGTKKGAYYLDDELTLLLLLELTIIFQKNPG